MLRIQAAGTPGQGPRAEMGVDLVASAEAGASFRSIGDPLWNTSSAQGQLLSTLLAGIAGERTGERRNGAPANGVKFGRKRKLSDYQRTEAVERRDAGETLAAIAKSDGVDLSMISRL